MSNLPLVDGGLRAHPIANIFPMIDRDDTRLLVEDIRTNGLNHKIVLFDGKILDGRNRYLAAIKAGLFEPESDADRVATLQAEYFEKYDSLTPALDWVLSENLHRRHLNASQRSMVGANLEGYRHGGSRAHDTEQDANLHLEQADLEDFLQDAPGMTRAEAADAMSVSTRSIADAAKVRDKGAPELVEAVSQGQVAVSSAAELTQLPVEEQAQIIRKADPKALNKVIKEQRDKKTQQKKEQRAEREATKAKALLDAGERKFGLIVTDNETRFETRSEKGLSRSPDNHYPTSSVEELMARPVGDLAAKDCVLAYWVTASQLAAGNAHKIIEAWGFEPKALYFWDKVVPGNGYWFRDQVEVLIIATRGKPVYPALGTQPTSLLTEQKGDHSAKPNGAMQMLESFFPKTPKIELNRRGAPRDGWWAWGNETAGDEARGITLDANGFADASHLPLLEPRPVLLSGEDNVAAAKEAAPKPKTSKKREKPTVNFFKEIRVADIPMIAVHTGDAVKLYATTNKSYFPAELGVYEIEIFTLEDVSPESAINDAVSSLHTANQASWKLPTVLYQTGRRGPIVKRQEAA